MVQNPHYGTPTNIWQIGLIMQVLMRKPPGGRPDWPNYTTYKSTATPRLKCGGPTAGSLLDAEQDYTGCNSIYSRELRSLIAECLILTPANRIPVQELVKRTVDGIASVQMSMGTVLGGPALSKWQEPVLSEQWLSGQNGVDPLASGFEASQIQGNQQRGQHAATRPPVLPMPAPPAPPRPQAQAQAPQAGPAQAAGPAARPTRPANASPFNRLRVIAQTKPKYSGLVAGGHKIFVVEDVNVNTTVVQVKDILERKGCGIKATGMNMMYGTKLMLNHQTLGEFPGLDAVRAMDA
jgi:hypothetical protein